jgi:hypothetical protein
MPTTFRLSSNDRRSLDLTHICFNLGSTWILIKLSFKSNHPSHDDSQVRSWSFQIDNTAPESNPTDEFGTCNPLIYPLHPLYPWKVLRQIKCLVTLELSFFENIASKSP